MGWFGWLVSLICIAPLYFLYNTGHPVLWVIILCNTIVNLWSAGIMHNYAIGQSVDRIKQLEKNLAQEGKLDAEKQAEIDRIPFAKNLDAVPGWITTINMLSSLAGLGFLGYAIWL